MNTTTTPARSEPDPDPGSFPMTTPRAFHVTFGLTLVLALALAAFAQWTRAQLPPNALVPMHWDIHGHVNGYGHTGSLFLMPATIAALSLLLYLVPRLDSRREHLLRSAKAYCSVWIASAFLLSALQIALLLTVLGHNIPIAKCTVVCTGLVLAIAGNYMGKVRSNHFFGVRTPWTLRSELSWNKSNRLGGRLLLLLGLISAVTALTPLPVSFLFWILLGGGFALTVFMMVYSYRIWCDDPDRRSQHTFQR